MHSPKNAGKLMGMFSVHDPDVALEKSLVTGEKRYVSKVGQKKLRLSWNTRLRALVYAKAVAARCKRMATAHNEKLRQMEKV